MSRVGKRPIQIPAGVTVKLHDGQIELKSSHGSCVCHVPTELQLAYDDGVREIRVTCMDDQRQTKAKHGLIRSLISNYAVGLSSPWVKRLEIVGVGYQAAMTNNQLKLSVGYANSVVVEIPKLVRCEVTDPTHITLSSPDKQVLGQVAANIRSVRPPEPYKGKGIKYVGEFIRRKSGKAFGS